MMNTRTLQQIIRSIPTSDGAGVKLRRSLGQTQALRLDPFLMLDEFSSDQADDYIAGFPAHPHRGFETVTYMLEGHMLHEDHLGNRGDLKSGGAQWMTAGRGIVHSEMPRQQSGRMRGFQLWVNLPAREKMKPAAYRDIQPEEIPEIEFAGGRAKVIAGKLELQDRVVSGPIQGISIEPLFLDVRLDGGAHFGHALPAQHSAFVYPYEGRITVRGAGDGREVPPHAAGILSVGEAVEVAAGEDAAAFLLLAGRPLREPVVQYGPFVMNTREQIEQAISDYQSGRFTT